MSTRTASTEAPRPGPYAERRGTIHVENARVAAHDIHPEHQYVLHLEAPVIAAAARPGSFVHLRCDPQLPLRRPMSIMRADPGAGTLEILYKAHGHGTRLLARRSPGERISLVGPIGVPFRLEGYRPRPLLLGGGVGIPPVVFLAEHMAATAPEVRPLVLMGSEVPFPFRPRPSKIMVADLPGEVIATDPALEAQGIACRLASGRGFPGCYEGTVVDLARHWLTALDAESLEQVEIYGCGPEPMLRAIADLAEEFERPCQVALEEYMACGVGGCAGCTVAVRTPEGTAMKRVCVDGPVFEAGVVVFQDTT